MNTFLLAAVTGSLLPSTPIIPTYATSSLGGILRSREAETLGQCTSSAKLCPQAGGCTDTAFGSKCVDLRSNYDCNTLVNKYNACQTCTCAPGTYDPNATPAPPKSGKCAGQTSSACFSALEQWQIDSLLAKHNELRASHGSCPLTYNNNIAAYSLSSSGFQSTCKTMSLTHNNPPQNTNGDRYGENLAMVGGSTELQDWDPANGVQSWYCGEEGCWDYASASNSGTTGHFTQVVWKDSTEVGCGLCHIKSGSMVNVYLICNYFTAGNFGSMGAGKDYAKNVQAIGTAASGCSGTPATNDECSSNPCGSDQTCSDPDQTKSNDYVCTCTNDKATSATGGQPTCTVDECASNPCGSGQTCNDPNKAASKSHDYTCTCTSDTSIVKTDGPATCTKDECASSPCGSGQTCKDPNQSPSSTGDYTCTCSNGVVATGGSATCTKDECTSNPCGSGQTCKDTKTAANSLNDYTCTCTSDSTITKTGGPATCSSNECDKKPCGTGQTCNDPNPIPSKTGDYTCTCSNGVVATGGSATCTKDECTSNPCGTGQTCKDANTAANSLNDYTCTCTNDNSIVKKGAPATCTLDECAANPCGAQQTCNDPKQSPSSTGDYVCTCPAPNQAITSTGSPATCTGGSNDECASSPCGAGQSCVDPDTASAPAKDYVCTCTTGTGTATGTPATCETDECKSSPCGPSQTCVDPNKAVASTGDYTCSCQAPQKGTKAGGPATCTLNECDANPCGTGQTCNDPTTSPTTTLDFTCTCANGVVATGTAATCEVDECASNPCGAGQTCNDPNKAKNSQHDYTCTCDNDKTIVQTDGPATCSKNECDANPCGTGQTCNDPVQSFASVHDFTCTCANGVVATGTAATCEIDECASNPCGAGQTCSDPNKAKSSQHDYTCTCNDDRTIVQTDGPARCVKNECDSNPCGMGQDCNDPNTALASKNDFTCTCTGTQLSATGGAVPSCGVDECLMSPCGAGQLCRDTDQLKTNDFECSCPFGLEHNIGAPVAVCDECKVGNVGSPCAWAGHPDVQETCNDPNPSADKLNDFVCTCPNKVSKVGGPAECEKQGECANSPCGAYQVCSDPDVNKAGDYKCACSAGVGEAVGGPATCVFDECASQPCPVLTQNCTDPNTSPNSTNDYVCTCKDPSMSGSKVGGEAACTRLTTNAPVAGNGTASPTKATPAPPVPPTPAPLMNECDNLPCNGQTCSDPTGLQKLGDFECSCDGKKETGKPVASCGVVDECLQAQVCGADQVCEDRNTSKSSLKDYVCKCKAGYAGDATVGRATSCTLDDECTGRDGCSGQQCTDPTGMQKLGDFVCTCVTKNTTKVGGPVQGCDYLDECENDPCGYGQVCKEDVKTVSSQKDFTCSCADGSGTPRLGGAVLLGCSGYELTPMNLQAAADAAPEDSKDGSSGTPVWVWILVVLGILGAIGGAVYVIMRRKKENVSLDDFIKSVDKEGIAHEMGGPSEQIRV